MLRAETLNPPPSPLPHTVYTVHLNACMHTASQPASQAHIYAHAHAPSPEPPTYLWMQRREADPGYTHEALLDHRCQEQVVHQVGQRGSRF